MRAFLVIRKIKRILSKHQKIRVAELMVIMIFGGFMEMLSVSLMLPFMGAVMDSEKIMENMQIAELGTTFSIESEKALLLMIAVVLAAVYILKNVYLMFQMAIQNRFILRNMLLMQQKLLHGILIRPYEYFLEANSGEIMRVLNDDVVGTFNFLESLLSIFSELIVSAFLIVTIFVISPWATISIALLLALMLGLIMIFVRPVLNRASVAQQKAKAKTNLWIMQAIQGVKELKMAHGECFFEENYKDNADIYAKSMYIYRIIAVMPRFLVEAVAMSAFFFAIAFMIGNGIELNKIIPILSGVAMAAMRLLPSVNRISAHISEIAYSEPMIDKLLEHIDESERYERKYEENERDLRGKITVDREIKFDDIIFRYPTGNANILENASFRIKKNQSVGIIGASGAGKSTAVDILLGLLRPQNGGVYIDGINIQCGLHSWMSHIGYIPQAIFLLDGNVRDNVAFGVKSVNVSDNRVWESLREAALDDFVKSLPDGLDTELGERGLRLSGGQRQRIGIARALYKNPDILVFDEATSALDNDTEKAIMEAINNLHGNKTLIIIAHRLTTIKNCDVIYEVAHGKIYEAVNSNWKIE